MQIRCEGCGRQFTAVRMSAKFCSSRCRSRAHAAGVREARLALVPVSTVVVDATRRELSSLGLSESDLVGAQALVAARHLDCAVGAASAMLSKLLRELMAEARLAAGRRPAGSVDELQARRRRRPRGLGRPDE